MIDMKCPFCKEEIISDLCFTFNKKDRDYTDGRQIYKCNKCGWYGNKKLWQELIRTRKALDVALDWLEQVATPAKCDDDLCREFTKRKLSEIKTALEQKE